jgi:3'-5' exoribonuclease
MYNKKQYIKDLKKDEIVNDIFVVKFKKPVESYKNGYKFELRIGDSSKEIMFKYWGPDNEKSVKEIYEAIKKDNVIHVQGKVNEWNDNLEISSGQKYPIVILKQGEYDIKAFIKVSQKNPEQMWKEILEIIDSITDSEIKKLVEFIFKEPEFVEKFKEIPAAMYIHHGWIHGLLEHTLSVCKIADNFCKIHPSLNRDFVIAGALLHDIGKLTEFEVNTSIRVTTPGMLIGHVTIGSDMIIKASEKCNTPENIKIKLLHIILTHMGEYGSSKTPSIPEALAVFNADQADAQLTHMIDLKENAETEDDYIYNKDFGNIYLK